MNGLHRYSPVDTHELYPSKCDYLPKLDILHEPTLKMSGSYYELPCSNNCLTQRHASSTDILFFKPMWNSVKNLYIRTRGGMFHKSCTPKYDENYYKIRNEKKM